MPQIVVKAIDSAEAMDQIQRLLGPDAMILETVRRDNQIEITATNDPIPVTPARQKPAPNPQAPLAFSSVLADSLKRQYEAQNNVTLDDFDASDEPAYRPRGYRSAPTSPPAPAKPVAFAAQAHVLVGPKGAGKTQLALQIAENIMSQGLARPRLVFLGRGSIADAAYLTQKAKLLGVDSITYSGADLDGDLPFDLTRDIIVWSADCDTDITSYDLGAARVVLALNAGLSPLAQNMCLEKWSTAREVVISQSRTLPAMPTDIALGQAVSVIALSDKETILNGLHAPLNVAQGAADIAPAEPAPTPRTPSALRKRWGGQTPDPTPAIRAVPKLHSGQRAPLRQPQTREGAKL